MGKLIWTLLAAIIPATAQYIPPVPIGYGTGSVTSVGLAMPSTFCSVSNSPVITTGTLTCTLATAQTHNLIFGTNSSGNVGLMNLTTAQLPSIASTLLNDQTNAPALTPGDAVVDVASNSFTDESSATSTTTISVGQTVSWKWVSGLHVVVSLSAHCGADPCASLEDQRFDSGDPTSTVGHRFSYTFTVQGTYYYYCDVHGQMMQGSVVVVQTATVHTPASSSEACIAGQMALDTSGGFIDFCTSTNSWKRASLGSF